MVKVVQLDLTVLQERMVLMVHLAFLVSLVQLDLMVLQERMVLMVLQE